MSFKTLHQFTVTVDKEVEETTMTTQDGKEITTKVKVKKAVPTVIVLKEPTRRERQEISLFSNVAYNEGINLGLLPKLVMTQKLSRDPTNPISGDDDKTLASMSSKLQELANDYIRLNAQSSTESDEARDRKERLLLEYIALQKKVTDINTAYQSVFAHTAEQYSQNRSLIWLTLFLSYIKVAEGKYEPMFPGADFKSKEDRLGEMEDNADEVYLKAVDKLSTYTMLFYFGRASKPEDFMRIEEEWQKQADAERLLKEQAAKVAEAAVPVVDSSATLVVDEAIKP